MRKFVNAFIVGGAVAFVAGCPIYSNSGGGSSGGGAPTCYDNGCGPGYSCLDEGYGPVCLPDDAGACPGGCSGGQTCELVNGVAACVYTNTPADAGADSGRPSSDASTDGSQSRDGSSSDGSLADGSTLNDGSSGDGSSTSDGASDGTWGDASGDAGVLDAGWGEAGPPVCTIDGEQGGCSTGSICVHFHCYNPCSLDAGTTSNPTCALVDQLNTCIGVATADAGYSVCVGTPGNQCNPSAGYGTCTSGGVCVNGYCE